jgi:hypothetical protein
VTTTASALVCSGYFDHQLDHHTVLAASVAVVAVQPVVGTMAILVAYLVTDQTVIVAVVTMAVVVATLATVCPLDVQASCHQSQVQMELGL